jgi:hypothetical protein
MEINKDKFIPLEEYGHSSVKSLTYSYATSPHSKKYNNGESCWLIFVSHHSFPIFLAQEKEIESALSYFEKMKGYITAACSFDRNLLKSRGVLSITEEA